MKWLIFAAHGQLIGDYSKCPWPIVFENAWKSFISFESSKQFEMTSSSTAWEQWTGHWASLTHCCPNVHKFFIWLLIVHDKLSNCVKRSLVLAMTSLFTAQEQRTGDKKRLVGCYVGWSFMGQILNNITCIVPTAIPSCPFHLASWMLESKVFERLFHCLYSDITQMFETVNKWKYS